MPTEDPARRLRLWRSKCQGLIGHLHFEVRLPSGTISPLPERRLELLAHFDKKGRVRIEQWRDSVRPPCAATWNRAPRSSGLHTRRREKRLLIETGLVRPQ